MLAIVLAAAATYDAYWNSPWPSRCLEHTPADALTKFGISANANNTFNGDSVSTLYNHPGEMTIGSWPCIDGSTGAEYNGGIPQLGNLSLHLAKVKRDVEAAFPDPAHSGLIVIDWEEWEPWFDFFPDPAPAHRWTYYMNRSYAHAGGDKALAIAQWNRSSLLFMAETLKAVVALRPQAKVGYYGMVNCGADVVQHGYTCPADIKARHDALAPLWAAGTALFPSIYSSCLYTNATGSAPARCVDGSHVELKIPLTLAETARVNRAGLPVIAFTWYTLYNAQCAHPPPKGLGHCPLMRNATDLKNEFALAKGAAGVDGIIVWGSSSDVRTHSSDCTLFGEYFEETLGPLLQGLVD